MIRALRHNILLLFFLYEGCQANHSMSEFLPPPDLPAPDQLPYETIPDLTLDLGQASPEESMMKQRYTPPLLLTPPEDLPEPLPDIQEPVSLEQELLPLPPIPITFTKKYAPKKKGLHGSRSRIKKAKNQETPLQKKNKEPAKKQNVPPSTSPALSNWVIPTKELLGRTEIALAASMSKTGENHIQGTHFFEGLTLYITNHNKKKDTNAPLVRIFSENDNSDILAAKKSITLLKYQSPLFIGLMGDDIVKETASLLKQQSLISLFPICGIEQLRTAPSSTQLFLRPPYKQELLVLCKYAIKVLRKESFGIFYEDSWWGNNLKHELVTILASFEKKADVEASYPEGSVNILQAVKTIAQKGPAVIFCLAHARAAAVFVRRALNEGLYKSIFFGISELIAIQPALKKLRGIEMVTTSIVPDPLTSNFPLAQEFRAAMKQNLPNRIISPFFFEGYISGALACTLLAQIKAPYTTMKLLKAAEKSGSFSLGGLPLKFDAPSRTFSSAVWINQGSDKPFLSEEALNSL